MSKRKTHIATLTRRRDYLLTLVGRGDRPSAGPESYDRKELTALDWAIRELNAERKPDMSDDNPERFEIYFVPAEGDPVFQCTTGTPEGIGVALFTQAEDRREAGVHDAPVAAIWDSKERDWITGPPQEGVEL